ncbi:hypothetical protein, partial [Mesorhizobium sp.]|uniref:hypothetical protein n=1 Tax=Mesorhizobium sp. TaxID=1871066 RepID=UPI0025DDC529
SLRQGRRHIGWGSFEKVNSEIQICSDPNYFDRSITTFSFTSWEIALRRSAGPGSTTVAREGKKRESAEEHHVSSFTKSSP